MSYLNGPRINFWGGASTNVDTANNTQSITPPGQKDPVDIIDLATATVTSPLDDDALIAELRQPATNSKGQNYYSQASWNYYGDHQVAFQNAKVSSSGAPGAVATDGALVGEPVYLLGSVDPVSGEGPYGGPVMVDLDPSSGQTTQIYVGGLQIGGATPKLLIRADTRCHSHFLGLRYDPATTAPPFLTPGSAWANGTFQVAFPNDAIKSWDQTCDDLRAIIEAPGAIGVVLRFSLFEFMPGKSTDEYQEDFRLNQNSANPSLGRVIGTIGPWFADEPATIPPGRLLQNTGLGGASGLAWLDQANQRLTLDLVSALPGAAIRQDATANSAPLGPNVDFGDLQIGTTASTTALATTPSLPATYHLFGGLHDIPIDAATCQALAAAPITIGSGTAAQPLQVVESPLRIYSNDRNIYLDDVGGKATLNLHMTELGGPLTADVIVALYTSPPGTLPDPRFLDYPTSVKVPTGATGFSVDVSDNGRAAGFVALNFDDGTNPTACFVNFRKYPAKDFAALIAAGGVTWDKVYQECLRFYYVLFPAMSKRIPLNDEATIRAVGTELLKRLSAQYRPTTLYMPLTRSMAPGRVKLLEAFLNQPNSSS